MVTSHIPFFDHDSLKSNTIKPIGLPLAMFDRRHEAFERKLEKLGLKHIAAQKAPAGLWCASSYVELCGSEGLRK